MRAMPASTARLAVALLTVDALVLLAALATVPSSPGRLIEGAGTSLVNQLVFGHLFVAGSIALATAVRRSVGRPLWLVLGLGCWFLVLFGLFELGEIVETAYEGWSEVGPNPWTPRIDDALGSLCAIVGVATFVRHRGELAHFGPARKLLFTGFAAALGGMLFDITAAMMDLLIPKFGETAHTRIPFAVLEWTEDALLLSGAAVLIVAVHWCYVIAATVEDGRRP